MEPVARPSVVSSNVIGRHGNPRNRGRQVRQHVHPAAAGAAAAAPPPPANIFGVAGHVDEQPPAAAASGPRKRGRPSNSARSGLARLAARGRLHELSPSVGGVGNKRSRSDRVRDRRRERPRTWRRMERLPNVEETDDDDGTDDDIADDHHDDDCGRSAASCCSSCSGHEGYDADRCADDFSDDGSSVASVGIPAPAAAPLPASQAPTSSRDARTARRHAPPPAPRTVVPFGQHDIGHQSACGECGAMVWPGERLNGKCCSGGKRVLGPNHNPPLDGADDKSARYRALLENKRIGPLSRAANNRASFTSMGTVPKQEHGGRGFEYQSKERPAVLHVHGKTYHVFVPVDRDGPLTRLAGGRTQEARQRLQLPAVFVVDGCEAARGGGVHALRPSRDQRLILEVAEFIRDTSPLLTKYVALMNTSASADNAPPTHIRFQVDSAPASGGQVEVALVAAGVEAPAQQRVLLTAVAEHGAASRAAAAAGGSGRAAGVGIDAVEVNGGCNGVARDNVDRGVKWTYVDNKSVLYELLQYPMLYENATGGWCKGVHAAKRNGKAHRLTLHKYVKSMLYQNKRLHYLTRLSCEWVLDMWSRSEELNLGVVRKLKNVQRFVAKRAVRRRDVHIEGAGRASYMPTSTPGSKKFLSNLIANGVARTTRKGNPTFFITITANPAWPEVTRALLPGQSAGERPDLVARVFALKLLAFKRDLSNGTFWGGRKQVYAMQVIEFQKRGLPHAHIALRISGQQPSVPDAIDSVISATMPPAHKPVGAAADEAAWWEGCLGQLPEGDPCRREGGNALKECKCRGHQRRRVVFKHMRHSCVPGRCFKVGTPERIAQRSCKYGYPFDLTEHTRYNDSGYPLYRRPGAEDASVVAHNVAMLMKYDTHINVEVAHTVLIIKYLHKYMAKGRDTILLADPSLAGDELELYQRMRYISASEALMKFFDIKLHCATPGVTPYNVHLPDEDRVRVPDAGVGDSSDSGSGGEPSSGRFAAADAAASQLSPLLRYFCRPGRLRELKMLDYYEKYHVLSPSAKSARAHSDDESEDFDGDDKSSIFSDDDNHHEEADRGSEAEYGRGGRGGRGGGRGRGRGRGRGGRGGGRGGGGANRGGGAPRGGGGTRGAARGRRAARGGRARTSSVISASTIDGELSDFEFYDPTSNEVLQDNPVLVGLPAAPSFNVTRRKRLHIARFYHVSPLDAERYYLRLLLENVAATSYDELYTVDGVKHVSFYDACKARLLVVSGQEHELSMRRCIEQLETPSGLRRHFSKLIMYNGANVDRRGLFWKFCADMAHDMHVPGRANDRFVLAALRDMSENSVRVNGVHAAAAWSVLNDLEAMAAREDKSLRNFGLPDPESFYDELPGHIRRTFSSGVHAPVVEAVLQRQNADRHRDAYNRCLQLATEEQKVAIEEAVRRLQTNEGGIMFIDAKAGRGKTWVLRAVAHWLWAEGKVNIACAFSGLASLNHDEGVTAHRAFALPLDVSFNDDTPSLLDRNSDRGRLLLASSCVMVDEICSLHTQYFKMIIDASREFQVDGKQKLIILAGDFRQTLPVCKSESSPAIIAACVKSNPYWAEVDTFQLHQPQRDARDPVYSQWVDMVGEGTAPGPVAVDVRGDSHFVTLPKDGAAADRSVRTFTDPRLFRQAVYGDLHTAQPEEVARRMIISPTNLTAAEHNLAYHEALPGVEVRLPAAHTCNVGNDLDPAFASSEYMSSVRDTTGNAPDADLRLKVGSVVFVCRNLDPEQRIMNGTKAEVLQIDKYCLKLRTFATPNYPATLFTLCRLQFEVKTGAFSFFRTQFPVRLAAASTIHKTQGQNLACVGLDARTHCFTHGQLYAALTRVSGISDLCVLLPPSTDLSGPVHVLNVVFMSVLQGHLSARQPLVRPCAVPPAEEAVASSSGTDYNLADNGSDMSSPNPSASRQRRVNEAGLRPGGARRSSPDAASGSESAASSSTASSALGGAAAVSRGRVMHARAGRSERRAPQWVEYQPSRAEMAESQCSSYFIPVIHSVLNFSGNHINDLRRRYAGFDALVAAYRSDFSNRGLNRSNIFFYGRNRYVPADVQERLLCPVGFNENGQSHVVQSLWDDFEAWINVQRSRARR